MKIISVNEHPERKDDDDFPGFAEELKKIEKLAEEKEAEEKKIKPQNQTEETSGKYWWQNY